MFIELCVAEYSDRPKKRNIKKIGPTTKTRDEENSEPYESISFFFVRFLAKLGQNSTDTLGIDTIRMYISNGDLVPVILAK